MWELGEGCGRTYFCYRGLYWGGSGWVSKGVGVDIVMYFVFIFLWYFILFVIIDMIGKILIEV